MKNGMSKLFVVILMVISNQVSAGTECDEATGSSQHGNCIAANSRQSSEDLVESKFQELVKIFDKQVSNKNDAYPFERLKMSLISSQSSWRKYRDDQCGYSNTVDAAASGSAGEEYSCYEKYNKERIEFLQNEIGEWVDGSLK